jgi:hypothetical protein
MFLFSLKTSLFQALANLQNFTGAATRVRLGGGSSDTSFWNPNNASFPNRYVTNSITPANLQVLAATYERTGIRFSLGVSMSNGDNLTISLPEVKAFANYLSM